MRHLIICSCLILCCLIVASPSFAQDLGQSSPQLAEETGQQQDPVFTQSTDPADSRENSTVPDALPATDAPDPATAGANLPAGASSSGSASAAPSSARGTTSTSIAYMFPTSGEMNRWWLRSTVGPKGLIGAAFTGTWKTWVNQSPEEWDQGGKGWSQRFGSALLDNGINTSALVLSSRAMHQDPRYRRCDCTGTWARARYAVKLSFMSRNRNGDLVFAPPKLLSPFTGPLVTRNTFYPDRFGSGDAATSGAYYLAGSVAWNLFREFVWNLTH